jgi:hypothetical protein
MSQPTRPFPQGTITEIRLSIDYPGFLTLVICARGSRRVVSGDPPPRVGMMELRGFRTLPHSDFGMLNSLNHAGYAT